jgi:hypothetical protein
MHGSHSAAARACGVSRRDEHLASNSVTVRRYHEWRRRSLFDEEFVLDSRAAGHACFLFVSLLFCRIAFLVHFLVCSACANLFCHLIYLFLYLSVRMFVLVFQPILYLSELTGGVLILFILFVLFVPGPYCLLLEIVQLAESNDFRKTLLTHA